MSWWVGYLEGLVAGVGACIVFTLLGQTPNARAMERGRRQVQWFSDHVTAPIWLWQHRKHVPIIRDSLAGVGWTWYECGHPCHKSHICTYGERMQR